MFKSWFQQQNTSIRFFQGNVSFNDEMSSFCRRSSAQARLDWRNFVDDSRRDTFRWCCFKFMLGLNIFPTPRPKYTSRSEPWSLLINVSNFNVSKLLCLFGWPAWYLTSVIGSLLALLLLLIMTFRYQSRFKLPPGAQRNSDSVDRADIQRGQKNLYGYRCSLYPASGSPSLNPFSCYPTCANSDSERIGLNPSWFPVEQLPCTVFFLQIYFPRSNF